MQKMDTSSQDRPLIEKEDTQSMKPWYWIPSEKLEIPPETRKIFEDYSEIPPDNVLPHVIATVRFNSTLLFVVFTAIVSCLLTLMFLSA